MKRKRLKRTTTKSTKVDRKFTSTFHLYAGVILTVLPCVLCLLYIRLYGINVAFWDQWELVPLLDKLRNGNLSFFDLFAQHNEHRILFPRSAMLLIASATHYNNITEMLFGWLLLCIMCYLLYLIYTNCSVAPDVSSSLMRFIPVAWLVFSFRQYENLLWGWQIQIFMAALFFVLAVYILESILCAKNKNFFGGFILAVASGVVSSFSFANGLLTWPIGFAQILISWWQTKKREKWLYLRTGLAWGLIGILVYVAYFINYSKPGHHPSLLYFLHHPLSSLYYFVVSVGSPLAVEKYTAVGAGSLLLFLYLYVISFFVVKKHTDGTTTAYLVVTFSLALFSLLSAILFTVGRAGFGVEQALSSRYTTITTLGVIGIYIFVVNVPYPKISQELKNILLSGFLSLITLGIISSYIYGIEDGEATRDFRNTISYYLCTFRFQSDENLKKLSPDPAQVKEMAKILEKYKLNVFAGSRPNVRGLYSTSHSTLYFVDFVNGHAVRQADSSFIINSDQEQTITISGWAVDQQAQKQAGGVFVTIDDKLDIPALYGLDRKDVADHFQNRRYRFSGFSASFATSVLGKGRHTVSLKIVTADKKGYYVADPKIVLEIK